MLFRSLDETLRSVPLDDVSENRLAIFDQLKPLLRGMLAFMRAAQTRARQHQLDAGSALCAPAHIDTVGSVGAVASVDE